RDRLIAKLRGQASREVHAPAYQARRTCGAWRSIRVARSTARTTTESLRTRSARGRRDDDHFWLACMRVITSAARRWPHTAPAAIESCMRAGWDETNFFPVGVS